MRQNPILRKAPRGFDGSGEDLQRKKTRTSFSGVRLQRNRQRLQSNPYYRVRTKKNKIKKKKKPLAFARRRRQPAHKSRMPVAKRLFIFKKAASRHHDDATKKNTASAPNPYNSANWQSRPMYELDTEPMSHELEVPGYYNRHELEAEVHERHELEGNIPASSYYQPNVPNNMPDAPGDQAANPAPALDRLGSFNAASDNADICLVHLKLLFAFQWMKEDVGFTDGLWGLWDSYAGPIDPTWLRQQNPVNSRGRRMGRVYYEETEVAPEIKAADRTLAFLSKVREKRWALFVARAVDRYYAWWQAVARREQCTPLTEDDMRMDGSAWYSEFTSNPDNVMPWSEDMLPPLGELTPFPSLSPPQPRVALVGCTLLFLAEVFSLTRCSRRPPSMARAHAESPGFPRGLHAGRVEAVLGYRHTVGAHQQGDRQ